MSLVTLTAVDKSFGAQEVLKDLSLQLRPGDKAGLIGPNGSGKSTLLQIIAGRLEPDRGAVGTARGTRVGYLPQEPGANARGTLRRHLQAPFEPLLALEREMAALEREMAAPAGEREERLARTLARYGDCRRRFEEGGGYRIESRINAVAAGLGFAPGDLDREMAGFSGGEKTRANLAALLLDDADLLLLDEPTNYLDLAGLNWLESYLTGCPAALLVVSHDRFFLDRVVTQILALEERTLQSYRGNYSVYRARFEAERKSRERAYREQQALVARTERQVRESKADRRSKRQARSRQKKLDRLDPLRRPAADRRPRLDLDCAGRSGRQVITFEQVSRSFGERILFAGLSFEIRWGDRVALVGPNGSGKTTLLKMIAGAGQPGRGQIRLGPAVSISYFAQEQEQLDPARTVLEEITAASDLGLSQARNHLGRYLFSGDDVFKKAASLSGGEKSRLALARLALRPGNCLLMDEPTSHLDLPALEELEAVLHRYPGTLVIVSHDRYFLKNLVNRVFELRGGALTIFEGSFQRYLELGERAPEEEPDRDRKEPAERRRRTLEDRRREQRLQNRARRLREEQARLEGEIHLAEAAVDRLEECFATPERYGDFKRLRELDEELRRAREALAALLRRWEEVGLQLEQHP